MTATLTLQTSLTDTQNTKFNWPGHRMSLLHHGVGVIGRSQLSRPTSEVHVRTILKKFNNKIFKHKLITIQTHLIQN